ncbi:MAG: copper amine oxidase N-terminal domain-containing protein, partial [Bacillota bacterium]|nr:copper amine oxidase N-terminal domain-containing protein [Bacillota bacterium]
MTSSNRKRYEKKHSSGEAPPGASPLGAKPPRGKTAEVKNRERCSSGGGRRSNRRYVENKQERLKVKRRRRIIKAGGFLALLLVIIGSCFGVLHMVAEKTEPATDVSTKPGVVSPTPFHTYFVLGSYQAFPVFRGEEPVDLQGITVDREGQVMAPLEGTAEALSIDVSSGADENSFTLTANGKSLTLTADSAEAQSQGEEVELAYAPYYQGDTLFVPVESIATALDMQAEYTEDEYRLDIYNGESPLATPKVVFRTDKDVYAPGEKVNFVAMAASSQDNAIVEYKWENRADRYFKPGTETITFSVKDYQGNWSPPISRKITIEGEEYVPAAKTPVLMYHWLTDDESDVQPGGKEYK